MIINVKEIKQINGWLMEFKLDSEANIFCISRRFVWESDSNVTIELEDGWSIECHNAYANRNETQYQALMDLIPLLSHFDRLSFSY